MDGELVKVKSSFFHSDLLPAGAAVYASPENLERYGAAAKKGQRKRTRHALQVRDDNFYLQLAVVQ